MVKARGRAAGMRARAIVGLFRVPSVEVYFLNDQRRNMLEKLRDDFTMETVCSYTAFQVMRTFPWAQPLFSLPYRS